MQGTSIPSMYLSWHVDDISNCYLCNNHSIHTRTNDQVSNIAVLTCRLLGCPEGRSAATWVDFNLYVPRHLLQIYAFLSICKNNHHFCRLCTAEIWNFDTWSIVFWCFIENKNTLLRRHCEMCMSIDAIFWNECILGNPHDQMGGMPRYLIMIFKSNTLQSNPSFVKITHRFFIQRRHWMHVRGVYWSDSWQWWE